MGVGGPEGVKEGLSRSRMGLGVWEGGFAGQGGV